MNHILKCPGCGSYGLDAKCSCGGMRSRPKPPRYSPEDKYGEYRRKYHEMKQDERVESKSLQEKKAE